MKNATTATMVPCSRFGGARFGSECQYGISISNGVLNSFYFAIGDYYRVPEARVVHVKKHYACATRNSGRIFPRKPCARGT